MYLCAFQGVKVDEKNAKGETARTLAMLYGHTKIASLIDMRSMRPKQGNVGKKQVLWL